MAEKEITFEEIQKNMIKKGGKGAHLVKTMEEVVEKRSKEVCDLCGKGRDEHDLRGFIYFAGSEDNLKAGWECVEKLVRENKGKGIKGKE